MLTELLEAAPWKGVMDAVGLGTTGAELDAPATPGTTAAVVAAAAGAGPVTRPTLDDGPVESAT